MTMETALEASLALFLGLTVMAVVSVHVPVFKYRNDSVLGVNRNSYESCIVSDPIFEFEDVDTVFWFNRHGFFYFISGNPDHCQAGQRLVVLVMGQSGLDVSHGPTAAPSPVEGGDTGGSSGYSIWASPPNATTKLSAASYFLSALGRQCKYAQEK
ncbi:hypothetical protein CDL15_Pgr012132 [Punica granatum]|uniref:Phytocyanin domain-containing protein n=1 Tax=Punica granatum TaxID=22663 RepID=A0A218XNL7_PUNGR|nr:hypothetical protein CDL15_Pgr012132 [Punica granatum]